MKRVLFIALILGATFSCTVSRAQEKKHSKEKEERVPFRDISFRDSLDHKFDMSEFLIDANGFIPVMTIISEPALGGFGLGAAPIFLRKRPPVIRETKKGKRLVLPIAPDVTAVGGFWTLNNSWGVIAGRMGSFAKGRFQYRGGGGYININMAFYRDITIGDSDPVNTEFDFNIKSVPVYAALMTRLGYSKWQSGLEYLFLYSNLKYTGDPLPYPLPDEFASQIDTDRIISLLGMIVEYDGRDNTFTPDRGIKFHLDGGMSKTWIGSDFDYWRLNYYAYMYQPFRFNIIGGLRIDGQQGFGDTPFYMLPHIDLRGVPAGKYQGNADILVEGEIRWDVVPRWSVVGFGGTGKAFDKWSEFGKADWVYNYGTGFRYLIARKFKLRVGLDIAGGPKGSWGYYVTFGSNWLK